MIEIRAAAEESYFVASTSVSDAERHGIHQVTKGAVWVVE